LTRAKLHRSRQIFSLLPGDLFGDHCTMAKTRQSIDDLIDSLVWMRREAARLAHNPDMTQDKCPTVGSSFAVPSSTDSDVAYAALKGSLSAVPVAGGT
jgi:hypothetical protein